MKEKILEILKRYNDVVIGFPYPAINGLSDYLVKELENVFTYSFGIKQQKYINQLQDENIELKAKLEKTDKYASMVEKEACDGDLSQCKWFLKATELQEKLKSAIFPKFKIGQEVWFISKKWNTVLDGKVSWIKLYGSAIYVGIENCYKEHEDQSKDINEIFATEQEALSALEKIKGEK